MDIPRSVLLRPLPIEEPPIDIDMPWFMGPLDREVGPVTPICDVRDAFTGENRAGEEEELL